jgi:hypothetical protein
VIPTKLFSRNDQVDAVNARELRKLSTAAPGSSRVYDADDFGHDERQLSGLRKSAPVAEKLRLVVGAQVMLLKNLDVPRGLVNGARGVVVAFKTPSSKGGGGGYGNYDGGDGDGGGGGGGGDDGGIISWEMEDWAPLPVVEFTVSVHANGQQTTKKVRATIEPQEWSVAMGGQTVAARLQIPLKLAWAMCEWVVLIVIVVVSQYV